VLAVDGDTPTEDLERFLEESNQLTPKAVRTAESQYTASEDELLQQDFEEFMQQTGQLPVPVGAKVDAAWQMLKDPARRQHLDGYLAAGGQFAGGGASRPASPPREPGHAPNTEDTEAAVAAAVEWNEAEHAVVLAEAVEARRELQEEARTWEQRAREER
jgi:hypothetical protein